MNDDLIKVLDGEIKKLVEKIQKATKNDFNGSGIGTYKNLILALKEVLKIKSEYSGINMYEVPTHYHTKESCIHCDDIEKETILIGSKNETMCSIKGRHLNLVERKDDSIITLSSISLNYCPICGRKFKHLNKISI